MGKGEEKNNFTIRSHTRGNLVRKWLPGHHKGGCHVAGNPLCPHKLALEKLYFKTPAKRSRDSGIGGVSLSVNGLKCFTEVVSLHVR